LNSGLRMEPTKLGRSPFKSSDGQAFFVGLIIRFTFATVLTLNARLVNELHVLS
jgi:hypothetical protein